MGKKTKKEKIMADLKRESSKTQVPQPLISPKLSVQTTSLYLYPVQLIKKDLTKTIVLSILAVSLELALFFILERNLVLPFRIKP